MIDRVVSFSFNLIIVIATIGVIATGLALLFNGFALYINRPYCTYENPSKKIRYIDSPKGSTSLDSIRRMMSNVLTKYLEIQRTQIFDRIIGYDGIKRTFFRSLNSEEPVHILLVGSPPDMQKRCFLKCILETVAGFAKHSSGNGLFKFGS